MQKINYSQLGRKLLKKHPELAKELIDSSKPAFNNFEMIPDLKEIYDKLTDPPKSTKEVTNYRLIFIAVIVRFYDPDAVTTNRRYLRAGLRKKLSETLNLSPCRISNLLQMVRDYTQIYSSFTGKVGYFYTKIDEHVFPGKE